MNNLLNFKSFLKFLGRNKAYTLIDVFGLSVSLMFVLLIAVYTVHVIFVGISFTYCSSSVWTMFFVGNVALFVLMRFCGLPNRVTNTY